MASVQRDGLWLWYLCVCMCMRIVYVHCGWKGAGTLYLYGPIHRNKCIFRYREILTQEMGRKRKCKSNIYKIYTPHPPTSSFPLYTLPVLLLYSWIYRAIKVENYRAYAMFVNENWAWGCLAVDCMQARRDTANTSKHT